MVEKEFYPSRPLEPTIAGGGSQINGLEAGGSTSHEGALVPTAGSFQPIELRTVSGWTKDVSVREREREQGVRVG